MKKYNNPNKGTQVFYYSTISFFQIKILMNFNLKDNTWLISYCAICYIVYILKKIKYNLIWEKPKS